MSNRALIAILILGLMVGGYLYADGEATKAINQTVNSMTFLDETITAGGAHYTYRFTNPSRYDVWYSYYAEVYVKSVYITTVQFDVTIPAGRSVVIGVDATIGSAAWEVLIENPNPAFRHVGQFEGRALWIISKSWTDEW